MTIDVLWAAWDGRGLEHLRLSMAASAVRADSLILAVADEGRPFRARYVVECDERWTFAGARIEVFEEPTRVIEVRADGRGHWTDAADGALPLDGCVDIDIYPSPFTNTLPMRRLAGAEIGEPVRVDVGWVALPELTIRRAAQEYTLLQRGPDGERWRFRALDSGFTAELATDGHRLVRDYPGIARRVL